MQEISTVDEARTCPNSHNPNMWYVCSDLTTCRSKETAAVANSAHQPLHLVCTDTSPFLHGFCKKGDKFFLSSLSAWGSGLSVACLLHDEGEPDGPAKAPAAGPRSQIAGTRRRLNEKTTCTPRNRRGT